MGVRHHASLEDAGNRFALVQICEELRHHIPVDQPLLSLIDTQFDVDSCRKFYGATWTPVGLTLGWFTGLTLGSAIATPVAGLTFGVICSVAAAIKAFSVGSDSGVGFAQYAINELL